MHLCLSRLDFYQIRFAYLKCLENIQNIKLKKCEDDGNSYSKENNKSKSVDSYFSGDFRIKKETNPK